MSTSTVFIGSLFGAILAAALAPPLFVSVPSRYVNNWYYMTHEGTLLGLGAALVILVLAGFLAAAARPDEPVRSGTSAGVFAALVGAIGMVLPAAAVMGSGGLLELVSSGRADALRLQTAAGDALLSSASLPAALAISMLSAGAALGAVGGVLYDLWRGTPSRPGRALHRSPVPLVVGWTLPLVGGATLYEMSWAAETREALQVESGWLSTVELTAPVLVAGLFVCGLLAWALRDAVITYRKDARLTAAIWAGAALGVPVVLALEHLALYPAGLLSPWPWLALGAVLITVVASVISAAGSDAVLDPEARDFGAVVGDAVQIGVLGVGQTLAVGGTWMITSGQLVEPYVRALLDGAGSVSATPEALVSRVFYAHWAAVGLAGAVAVAWLVVGIPLWLVGRASALRRG